ncbi:MAG: hypothetical protein RL660_2328 [Bacteroidota bacterium]|jgi:hypothetical protein
MKYTKDDILQMLIAEYKYCIAFDLGVLKDKDINYESSILEWLDTFDLVDTIRLAKIYHRKFNLSRPLSELENLLEDQENTTISDFCEYIAANAEREKIDPIKLLGRNCTSAAIFRALKNKLAAIGIDTKGLKPSSEINPFFLKYGGQLFSEVNRLAPGTWTEFDFKPNKMSRLGRNILFLGVLLLICRCCFGKFQWQLTLPIIIGIVLSYIGDKNQPERLSINGFKNFRQLILAIERNLSEAGVC